jgi:hypothetical protein
LETTGLNCREGFLRSILPFGQIVTIKLEASRKTLFRRIGRKKKKDRGGQWLYNATYRDKYEFVQKLFKNFSKVHADYYIDTDRLSKVDVFRKAFDKINSVREMMPDE